MPINAGPLVSGGGLKRWCKQSNLLSRNWDQTVPMIEITLTIDCTTSKKESSKYIHLHTQLTSSSITPLIGSCGALVWRSLGSEDRVETRNLSANFFVEIPCWNPTLEESISKTAVHTLKREYFIEIEMQPHWYTSRSIWNIWRMYPASQI